MSFWLFKTEPSSYSIDDLKRDGSTHWDGVRNYQARNFLRDDMTAGDGVLIYHSNVEPMAIVGTAIILKAGYADHTQFEAGHAHFDPTAKAEAPRWYMVDIAFERAFAHHRTLAELKGIPALKDMGLLRKGNRLSVQPVSEKEWNAILAMLP